MISNQVAFVDSSLPNYQTLIASLPVGVDVQLIGPNQDGVQVIAEWAESRSGYSVIHIIGHGTSGAQQLGSAVLSQDSLDRYQNELTQIGNVLTDDGDILLYGCDVAAEQSGLEFIGKLSEISGADIAASNDLTGSADLGGDWNLEASTGDIGASIAIENYSTVLAQDQVHDHLETIYVRPNETSYIWTWGTGQGVDWSTPNNDWYDASFTKVSIGSVPDFGWYLDRGYFEYSSNNGASWTKYTTTVNGSSFTNVAGTQWRFVDTQTHTNEDHVGFWYYVTGATTSTGTSGLFIKVDEAPTDINSSNASGVLVSDTPDGETVATLDPVDTGYTREGVWVLESQSHAGLFTLQSDTSSNDRADLILSSAHLPVEGTDVSVTVRYYDIYQLDRDGTPLNGEGISKTYTYTVKGPSDDLGFNDDTTVNSLVGDTANQDYSSVTELTTGDFVVTWSDNTNGGVYAQIYNAAGVAQGTVITVDAGVTYKSDAVALSDGKFAVVYVYPNAEDIAYRIIEADGTVGAEVSVATAEWDSWSTVNVVPSSDHSSFTLTWNTDDYSTLKKATYSDSGALLSATSTLTPTGYAPVSAVLSNGDIVTAVGDADTWTGLNLIINDVAIQSTYDTPIGDTGSLHSLTSLAAGGLCLLGWMLVGSIFRHKFLITVA